jgi:subtilisin-like proprotein convertase family protein
MNLTINQLGGNMKKRILFITLVLLAAMFFTTALLADAPTNLHLIDRSNSGECFETATVAGGSIPDNVAAGICWDMTVGGAGTTVADVNVDVAATHTWIGDLEFWLVSPDASTLYMLDRPAYVGQAPGCCGDSSELIASSPLNFADANPNNAETMGGTIGDTQQVCEDDGQCDFYPNPDGAAGHPNFAGFAGENTAGTWSFCAADNAALDVGSVGSITVNVSCVAPAVPELAFTKTVGTDPNTCATTDSITIPAGGGGTDVTYCYYMTNTGTVTFELHTVDDDQLGTVLGPGFASSVGPGDSAWFTVTTLITQTTVNSATWSATDAAGGNGASASASATVTQGAPTDVSLSSFGSDQAALSPLWLAALLAIVLGLGFVLRRKMAAE